MAERHHLDDLLRNLSPELLDDEYVYASLPSDRLAGLRVDASVREPEGLSIVLRRTEADRHGIEYGTAMRWITLTVESALDDIGMTAAFAAALTEAGISCNVLAGLHHDHLLVPAADADAAVAALQALSRGRGGA